MAKGRAALGLLATLAASVTLAGVAVPAYGQAARVGNTGQAVASSGGNSSVGNNSTNAATNSTTASTVPPSLLGSVVGLALNLTTTSSNTSTGTSGINTGPAQASGNNSDTAVRQADVGGGGGGGVGRVYSPYGPGPYDGRLIGGGERADVANAGTAAASTGDNSGTGNNSTNVAANTQNVSGGLISVGLSLLNNASNTSNGTSAINTGAASAAGNTATNAVDQTRVGGAGGPGGPGARFGIGGGAVCDGFFGLRGERARVLNSGDAVASSGGNTSVGNQSQNVATNDFTGPGGAISVNAPGLLGNNTANASDGASAINTGPAAASGNQSTTAVEQQCIQEARFASPPVITPPGFRPGGREVPIVASRQQQLARTGVDPFVLALVAFALLFGGFLFMVWERVESFPTGGGTPAV